MFSLSFAVVLLITIGVNGQTNDINTFRPIHLEKGYPFGKLRLSEEGKNEELISPINIEKSQIDPDQSSGGQPLPSPCIGSSPSTKLVYPRDKTKYIQCRDEFHYEIFTCPNGGDYNDQTNSCDLILPTIDKCEQEKPCLNDGHCQLLSNSTFKCTCRQDWIGDRCETPINSCVKKPCGPNADCRTLKTTDYEQDYVCVCQGTKSYGLNCQQVVPNPCLTTGEQFFPYAFSQRAYIQCNGELIYFQPCGSLLFWNQEDKNCDRKRSAKIDFSTLLTKLVSNNNENQQEKDRENTIEEINLTTTGQMEQQNLFNENEKENEGTLAFVPARMTNRQQLQANVNNQQGSFGQNLGDNGQNTQELPNPSVESNQMRQNFMSRTKQWPNHQTESTVRQPPIIQSGQNQPWSQNTAQQWTPTLTEPSSMNSNMGQSQIRQDNQQQQNFPQQNQVFGSQQWSNQVPDMKPQNDQRFDSQPQSWQGSQIIQNQPQFQNQNQQTSFETTTAAQNIVRLQGFQNPKTLAQDQPWQTRPNSQTIGNQSPPSIGFSPQITQNIVPQSWQSFQTIQNQPQLPNENQQSFVETTTAAQNIIRLQGFHNPNTQAQDQSWKTKPKTQWSGNQSPQSVGFNPQNTQNFVPQTQSWQSSQTMQNQPQFQIQNEQTAFETTTTAQNVVRLQGFQTPNTQLTGNQSPQSVKFNPQNTPNLVPQSKSWQGSPLFQNQQQLTPTNPEGISMDNKNRLNTVVQNQQPWQNKGNNQIRQNFIQPEPSLIDIQQFPLSNEQPSTGQLQKGFQQQNQVFGNQQWSNPAPDMKTQTNQPFGIQPQSWQGSQTTQNQPQLQNQNQESSPETTTVAQNIVRLQGFQNPNTPTQGQSWQNRPITQPLQNQLNKPQSDQVFAFQPKQWPDTSKQTQQPFTVNPWSEIQNTQFGLNQQQQLNLPTQNSFDQSQPWSQNGQITGNSFEATTIANKGFPIQGLRGWQPNRPVEQDNNQITPTEQRKTLDSIPTRLSGSWKSRSQ